MPLTGGARDLKPPRMPGPRGAAAPQAATTWKLCIPRKESTHHACFVSAGRKVSTLTADQAPMGRPLPGARPMMSLLIPSRSEVLSAKAVQSDSAGHNVPRKGSPKRDGEAHAA
jgi:hypothetical protein